MCDLCHGLGWVLEQGHRNAANVYLIECPLPDCSESGRAVTVELLDTAAGRLVEGHTEYLLRGRGWALEPISGDPGRLRLTPQDEDDPNLLRWVIGDELAAETPRGGKVLHVGFRVAKRRLRKAGQLLLILECPNPARPL